MENFETLTFEDSPQKTAIYLRVYADLLKTAKIEGMEGVQNIMLAAANHLEHMLTGAQVGTIIKQIVPESPIAIEDARDIIKEHYSSLNPDERVKFDHMVADIFQAEMEKEIKRMKNHD